MSGYARVGGRQRKEKRPAKHGSWGCPSFDGGFLSGSDWSAPTEYDLLKISVLNAAFTLAVAGVVFGDTGDVRARTLHLTLFGAKDRSWVWPADSIALMLALLPFVPSLVHVVLVRHFGRKPRKITTATAAVLNCILTDAGLSIYNAHLSGTTDLFTFLLLLSLSLSAVILIFRLRGTEHFSDEDVAKMKKNPGAFVDEIESAAIYYLVFVLFTAPIIVVLVQRFAGPIEIDDKGDGDNCPFCYSIALGLSAAYLWTRNVCVLLGKYGAVEKVHEARSSAESSSPDRGHPHVAITSRNSAIFATLFGLEALALGLVVGLGWGGIGGDAMEQTWARLTWISNGSLEFDVRWPVATMIPAAALCYALAFACSARTDDAEELSRKIRMDGAHFKFPALIALGDAALFVLAASVAGLTDLFSIVLGILLILVSTFIFVHLGKQSMSVLVLFTFLLGSAPYGLVLSAYGRHTYTHEVGKSTAALAITVAAAGILKCLLATLAYGVAKTRRAPWLGRWPHTIVVRPAIDAAVVLAAYLLCSVGDALDLKSQA